MPPKSNLPQSSTSYTENQYQLRRHPVPTTPKRHTVSMGVSLLVFAAAVLGAVAYFECARTGRLYSPIAVHLTWSTAMVLILPSVF